MLRKNPRDERYSDASLQYEEELPTAYTGSEGDTVAASGRASTGYGESYDSGASTHETRGQSVIDAASTFDGRFESGQDLVILGRVTGEIVCRGMLTIERDASAKAKVQSRDAQVRGQLEGDIVCSGRLVLASTANVTGTLKASALVVEEGATIRGTVETTASAGSELAGAIDKPGKGSRANTAEDNGATGTSRGRNREVPTFALVSSEERPLERN